MRFGRPTIASAVAVLGLSVTVAACGSGSGNGNGTAGASGSSSGKKIALLLPEHTTARYETQDRPHFESMVKSLCPTCSVVYENANQDASEQQSQAESVLTQGIDAMVLDPVDATSASTIVRMAKAQNVPVISYDRLVSGGNLAAYISFDNVRVGALQATSLEKKLKQDGSAKGPIVMLNGDPTDNNAHLFKQGASSVFSKDGVKIAKSYDTQGYTPANAQTEMQQAITALGNDGFAGVYDANDGIATGAITAMKDAGINPASRPTTGQDAELDGIQRILAGQQYMTVYKAVKTEAQDAARLAVPLAKGQPLPANLINQHTKSGKHERAVRDPDAGGRHQGERQVDGHQGRLLDAGADLHARLRERLQGGRDHAMSAPLLALRGVSKSFGAVQALDGVDFEVHAGEVVGLVGDNGAGKSTLVKIISGIHPPDRGEISMDGIPVTIRTPEDATRLGIATVYQDLALADNLDVVANLFLGHEQRSSGPARATWQIDETAMEHRSHELLERFAVTIPNVRTEVAALSGGQRQQVAVARSLLGEPKVVLLDEPTAALGVAQTAQVLLLIKQLRERGLGVVVISHNLADVFEVADRVFVLRLGRPAGTFDVARATQDEVVAAITGARLHADAVSGDGGRT